MTYRIIYVKDVEFGGLSRDFWASDDVEAKEKAQDEIKKLKQRHGDGILIRRLQRVERVSEMQEKVKDISF